MDEIDDNPYQSPQSESAPLEERQRGRAPLIVRAFLSGWTGMAITLFMLASALLAASSQPTQPYIELVFAGLGLAILWFAAHGIAAIVWR